MKLVNKGIFKNEEELPKGNLPSNAVKFREPDTAKELNKKVIIFILPAIGLAGIIILLAMFIHGDKIKMNYGLSVFIGLFFSYLCIIPHELLHGICFGKKAVVELYFAPKKLMAFVVSNQPISKTRFILLSLCPNIIFGWIPLILWAIFPTMPYHNVVFYFSLISIAMGGGDYMNVWNAIIQMPKGSMQQMSGFNSYWFIP